MKVLHNCVLLKEIKQTSASDLIPLNEVDHVEVAFIADDVTKVKPGDTVIYRNGEGIVKIGEENYILVAEENIKVIL